MNKTELTKLNVGYNLDWLMNLDPRGYGVCRILYDGASKYTGKPLSLNGAEGLVKNIKKGEKVFILTGFILLPWNEAETDGIISSTVFARFVIRAFGAKPVMIVPEQCEKAIKAMSEVLGVNITYDIDNIPDNTICIISFTKDKNKENEETAELLSHGLPCAVISNEAPGRNKKKVYTLCRKRRLQGRNRLRHFGRHCCRQYYHCNRKRLGYECTYGLYGFPFR